MKSYPYIEVSSVDALPSPATGTNLIVHYAFQYIDFNQAVQYAEENIFVDCCFFGCKFIPGQDRRLEACLVLPRMGMLFRAFNVSLYSGKTLYEGFDPDKPETLETCFDGKVYADYLKHGQSSDDLRVMLARALHDHSIGDEMHDFLERYDRRDIVGIMGGHSLKRTDPMFRQIVYISKSLTEKGKLMVSGGGPGAMEATHLGAWMAGRDLGEVDDALSMLSSAPTYQEDGWLSTAFKVCEKYPQRRYHSLGIPTWLYGHEPSTPFATEIAKFFDNSIREDRILSIAGGGIIFTPGSAGTLQEIFQSAAQNHYSTSGSPSPMVFLGTEYYTSTVPVYLLLTDLVRRERYQNLQLSITDDPDEAINTLMEFN